MTESGGVTCDYPSVLCNTCGGFRVILIEIAYQARTYCLFFDMRHDNVSYKKEVSIMFCS